MSDNAKCFEFAKEKLSTLFLTDGPRWRFIPPISPWFGGFWERLIGLVKQGLRRSNGKRILTHAELEVTLVEVEMMLNSRPLTFVGDKFEQNEVLTPAHFLIGRNTLSKCVENSEDLSFQTVDLAQRWQCRSEALNEFWQFWSNNYLRYLPPFKGPKVDKTLKEGEVVLIREENIPRLRWPLALVLKILPSIDEAPRVVQLKTEKGTLIRPIQKLHSLELVHSHENMPNVIKDDKKEIEIKEVLKSPSADDKTELKTRSGRLVKPKRDENFIYHT